MRSTHNSPFIPRRDAEPLARPRRPIRGGDLAVPFEADLDTLLARSDIDAVCVVTPTNLHRDVMVAAANAGKHIFTEKVLATSVADCQAIA